MDDFDLRDMLAPPLRMRSDLPQAAPHNEHHARPEPMVLGMAYVPNQHWQDLYEAEAGFPRGTIFKQLDLPFEGGAGR
jgi:hypothetical protein